MPRLALALFSKKAKLGGLSGALGSGPKGAAAATSTKIKLPVETDPHKLVNYVCGSNIYKVGEDVKLKDDSEYPDWLWKLRLNGLPSLEELDPNTIEYWERLRSLHMSRTCRLFRSKKREEMRLNEEKNKLEKLRALRFRVLAGHYYDPGYDPKHDINTGTGKKLYKI